MQTPITYESAKQLAVKQRSRKCSGKFKADVTGREGVWSGKWERKWRGDYKSLQKGAYCFLRDLESSRTGQCVSESHSGGNSGAEGTRLGSEGQKEALVELR